MQLTSRLRHLLLAAISCSGLLPIGAVAAGSTQQEFMAVLRVMPNLERGAELFRQCAACHGPSGNGSEQGDVPRIAGQHFNVLVRQIVDYRHDTRWDIRMEHYAGRNVLGDAQAIADVAEYVSRLARDRPRNVGDGKLVEHGAEIYAKRCAGCHGPQGEGDDPGSIPRLAGQHYEYVLRQMYDAVDGRRPNFPRQHIRLLAHLERDDLVGIADFLSRSEWTGPAEQLASAR
ncbi:MAG: c-type cytochrome [Gammaproteobacteria bacterium]